MWIKWYPMQWLHSTCRDELNAAQRATFQDFVCLAAVSPKPGMFKFVSHKSLARTLNTPVETVRTTIKICIKKKRIHITEGPEGMACKILKWPDYQSFGARRPKKKKDPASISFNFASREWEGITIEDKSGWLAAYPACDIEVELYKMREWLLANPEKKKKNYRRFITNWLSRTQDKGGSEKIKRHPGGRPLTRKDARKQRIEDWTKTPEEK